MCAFYVCAIGLMKYLRNYKFFNFVFVASVFIPYVLLCIKIYKDVGFYDWNFQNALPVANVSPFMFAIVPLVLILPKKVKKHLLLLISLLSVGMFVSTVLSCMYNAIINYKFHWHFMLNYLSHFMLSLFGVYLIRSGQVELKCKNCLISSSIIFCVATFMMVLNVIFDTSFFGLSLNGKHNIYNNVLVENSYVSALLYYCGLAGVLLLGYFYSKMHQKRRQKI
jgi:hypothetical protein